MTESWWQHHKHYPGIIIIIVIITETEIFHILWLVYVRLESGSFWSGSVISMLYNELRK